jgi:hypothetical protein
MTASAPKYAAAFDLRVLGFFRHLTYTENAEVALDTWVPADDLPHHHRCLAAVMFRSYNGVSTLTAALALADDTGHVVWNPEAMSSRSKRRKALCDYWDWTERIRPTNEEGDRLIRAALPLYGADADTTDIDLARDLFGTTLDGDEYGRSRRIRLLLMRLAAAEPSPVSSSSGGA